MEIEELVNIIQREVQDKKPVLDAPGSKERKLELDAAFAVRRYLVEIGFNPKSIPSVNEITLYSKIYSRTRNY